MDFQRAGARGAQQIGQGGALLRQAEGEVGESVRLGGVLHHAPAGQGGAVAVFRVGQGTQDDGAAALGDDLGGAGLHGTFHPAAAGMGDEDGGASCRAGVPACKVQIAARGGQTILGGHLPGPILHEAGVAGVQLRQHGEVALHQRLPRGPECGGTVMADHDAGGCDMPPAQGCGAAAPIVFLAVALGEHILPQQSGLDQRLMAEIEAEADAGGQIDRDIGVG